MAEMFSLPSFMTKEVSFEAFLKSILIVALLVFVFLFFGKVKSVKNINPMAHQKVFSQIKAKSIWICEKQKDNGRNSEVHILAVVSFAMVASLLTEVLGLSLDFGAFLAGFLLGGSHFSEKTIKAIEPLSSVFGGMLFASIGMIINPLFIFSNLGTVMIIIVQTLLLKTIVIYAVLRTLQFKQGDKRVKIRASMGLSHIGEFSLLFSSKLHQHHLMNRRVYLLLLSATIGTLVFTTLMLKTTVPNRLKKKEKAKRNLDQQFSKVVSF